MSQRLYESHAPTSPGIKRDERSTQREQRKERKEKNANSFCNFFQPAHNARPEKFLQLRQVEKRIWEFLTFELIKTDEFKKTVQASQYDGLGGFPTSCHDAILYLH